jgi:hypothetical protein
MFSLKTAIHVKLSDLNPSNNAKAVCMTTLSCEMINLSFASVALKTPEQFEEKVKHKEPSSKDPQFPRAFFLRSEPLFSQSQTPSYASKTKNDKNSAYVTWRVEHIWEQRYGA